MSRATVQRRAVRRAAPTRCQVVELNEFSLLSEQVLDLSARGMLVACTRKPQVGDALQVSFRAPGPNVLWFDAEARIARVVAGQRWCDDGLAAGIEFTYFEKSCRHELMRRLVGFPLPLPKLRGAWALAGARKAAIPRGLFEIG